MQSIFAGAHRILCGTETEYGLLIEGRGADQQVDDATAFVRAYPGSHFAGWDYRYESPRADLRGFSVSRLAQDPDDAKFDQGAKRTHDGDVRSDRILPNGARFYNDHGHPEYSTPECWSIEDVAMHDAAGELVLLDSAKAYSDQTGLKVQIYKNNTDFHGASYGSHESYLVPRNVGFERLYKAVMPMLVARQILTGAGKVGAEHGRSCAYQISQRADFFVEPFNTETLFRRPIFNTRDEPHGDPARWIRMHVISGDANMMYSCTRRKVGLVQMAVSLAIAGEAPDWKIKRPVEAFQSISRDESNKFEVELEGNSWTTAYEILESYFAAIEAVFPVPTFEPYLYITIDECRKLLLDLNQCPERFAQKVDWAAKKRMLEHFMEEEGIDWNAPQLRSFDLEYHNIDPEEGLFHALVSMGAVEPQPNILFLQSRLRQPLMTTRAWARSIAVRQFPDDLLTASWRSLVFKTENGNQELLLEPHCSYPVQLGAAEDVGTFIQWIQDLKSSKQTND